MDECNCIGQGSGLPKLPNPHARCPVHHPLDPTRPDPYLRALAQMPQYRINHRHHIDEKLVWEGDPKNCPHCPRS